MPPVSPRMVAGNSVSRLRQVLATGCGSWDEKTRTTVETPCGVALTFAEDGKEQPVVVLATRKSIQSFSRRLDIKSHQTPSGWSNEWAVKPPYALPYDRFYAVSGVNVNDDAELISGLGMYAFPADESGKYKAWQTEVCKRCGCTSVILFQSHR